MGNRHAHGYSKNTIIIASATKPLFLLPYYYYCYYLFPPFLPPLLPLLPLTQSPLLTISLHLVVAHRPTLLRRYRLPPYHSYQYELIYRNCDNERRE